MVKNKFSEIAYSRNKSTSAKQPDLMKIKRKCIDSTTGIGYIVLVPEEIEVFETSKILIYY
jgi:hypothetical protein